MKAELKQNIAETFSKLNAVLSSFSENEMNTIPFEGSWTAGQVANHLIMAMSGLPELCNGKTEKSLREPDEKIKNIKAIFLDFTIKMESPESLYPSEIECNKNSILLSLQKIKQDMLNIAETNDLTLTCLDFELPVFGKFTIYEWLSFALIHSQRHIQQLNTIFQKMAKS
jgi:hypothetical protein